MSRRTRPAVGMPAGACALGVISSQDAHGACCCKGLPEHSPLAFGGKLALLCGRALRIRVHARHMQQEHVRLCGSKHGSVKPRGMHTFSLQATSGRYIARDAGP